MRFAPNGQSMLFASPPAPAIELLNYKCPPLMPRGMFFYPVVLHRKSLAHDLRETTSRVSLILWGYGRRQNDSGGLETLRWAAGRRLWSPKQVDLDPRSLFSPLSWATVLLFAYLGVKILPTSLHFTKSKEEKPAESKRTPNAVVSREFISSNLF